MAEFLSSAWLLLAAGCCVASAFAAAVGVGSSGRASSAEPSPAVPASKPFPFPYSDSFESYKPEATVKYFTDQGGSFNADTTPTAPTAANGQPKAGTMALHQVVDVRPIEWGHNPDPMTIGGDITWSDYTVSIKAMIGSKSPLPPDTPTNTTNNSNINGGGEMASPPPPPTSKVQPGVTSVKLCGRIGSYSRGGSPPNGYCLIVDDEGSWYISNGEQNAFFGAVLYLRNDHFTKTGSGQA
eukprot:COSAG06_NODE_854_length_11931_cov_55.985970_11_plen_240_part_00